MTVEKANTTDIPVLYYTGKGFNKSNAPIVDSRGEVVQTINGDGSITITVKSNGYIDSGIVMEIGTLGELGSITVEGTGDYGLNLYFDLDKDGEFFSWDGNTFKGVGNDAYALGVIDPSNQLVIDDSTSFFLMGQSQGKYEYTLSELKAEYDLDTPVGIWIGVTSPDGDERTATIESVTVSVAERQDARNEVIQPEAEEPEAGEPEAAEPEAEEPQAGEPEAEEPEAEEPEAEEPEAEEPEAVEPEAVEPEAAEPEAAEPEAGEPEAEEPEADELEAAEPEAGEPEAEEPEADEPEAGEPEAA